MSDDAKRERIIDAIQAMKAKILESLGDPFDPDEIRAGFTKALDARKRMTPDERKREFFDDLEIAEVAIEIGEDVDELFLGSFAIQVAKGEITAEKALTFLDASPFGPNYKGGE